MHEAEIGFVVSIAEVEPSMSSRTQGSDGQLRAKALSPFIFQTLGTFHLIRERRRSARPKELIENGNVAPAIDRTFALAQTAAAIRTCSTGARKGRSSSRPDPMGTAIATTRRGSECRAARLGVLAVIGLVVAFSLSSTLLKRAVVHGTPQCS